jgi:hypothetical protein
MLLYKNQGRGKMNCKNKFQVVFVGFSLFFLLFLSLGLTVSNINQKALPSVSKISSNGVSVVPYSDLWESAWIWVDSSGWMNARAEVHSKDLGFGEKNLNLFIASYPQIYDIFDHANWWFGSTDDPMEQNVQMNFRFRTTDPELARSYADLIVQYMIQELGLTYIYHGTWAWEDWRDNQWENLTTVVYRAHIDWPWFTQFINDDVIPRNVGGLAETINVTESNHISAWAWPSGYEGNPEISFAFGFEFHYDIYDYTHSYFGSHSLTMNDLIHTSKIQKSSYQDILTVNFELPNVTSISSIPSANDSSIMIFSDYHPPPEPWVQHHYWDVRFEITSGVFYSITVNFNFNFLPWWLTSRASAELSINHYGYQAKSMHLQGQYAQLIDIQSLTNWDNNVVVIEMRFRPLRYSTTLPGHMRHSFELFINYPDNNDHYTDANALAMDIGSFLGVSYRSNQSEPWNWWDPYYDGIRYYFESEEFNLTMSQNLLLDSDVILSTPMFDNQNISELTDYWQVAEYFGRTNTWTNRMDFQWDPLAEEVTFPTKTYVGMQLALNIDLISEWGWASFPYNSNYSSSEFSITHPFNEYSVYPDENNGWGWHINEWDDHWGSLHFKTHNLEIYTEASSLEFTNQYNEPNGTPFDQFGVFFDYDFHDDSEDFSPPNTDLFYKDDYGNEYWNDWEISQSYTFSGTDEHIRVRAYDDSNFGIHGWWWNFYYWNGTHQAPRFGSTGVESVSVQAYFADLPVEAEQFAKDLPLTKNWGDELSAEYNVSWNTLAGFADGEWTLVSHVEDNNGMTGSYSLHNLVVDNYDDSITSSPVINLLSAENTSISGTHTILASITDDIGIFAVILTIDSSGWLMTDLDTDNIYEFDWNTLGDLEGSLHLLTITVWDMDGHKTIYGYWLEIDNIPSGNPPSIEFLAPSASNETLTDVYIFRVKVTDDLGLSSVKLQIDSGASLAMDYISISDEYSYSFNVSTLVNGYHWVKVTAVDIDENQHEITEMIDITVIGGQEGPIVSNAPEWDSSLSDLPENLSEYVQSGRFLDYIAVSENIYFKVAVRDDNGIAATDFTVYAIDNFDPSTGEPDTSDLRQVLTDALSMSGTNGDWDIYEYTWDSTTSADDYYLCEFDVQDIDEIANHLYIRVIIETDNVAGDDSPPLLTPSFEVELIILGLSTWCIISIKNRRRYKRSEQK